MPVLPTRLPTLAEVDHPRLTTRQLQVLCAIERSPDWSVDAAAHVLGISRDGIYYHIDGARQKCGRCATLGQLIAYHIVRDERVCACSVRARTTQGGSGRVG